MSASAHWLLLLLSARLVQQSCWGLSSVERELIEHCPVCLLHAFQVISVGSDGITIPSITIDNAIC